MRAMHQDRAFTLIPDKAEAKAPVTITRRQRLALGFLLNGLDDARLDAGSLEWGVILDRHTLDSARSALAMLVPRLPAAEE